MGSVHFFLLFYLLGTDGRVNDITLSISSLSVAT